ncbi:MAG TPA: manganese efflux pump [Bacteroidales bacterium]|nr:manganese efflux pump [Bacteroidales bacterium]
MELLLIIPFVLSFALAMNSFGLAIINSSVSGKVLPGISIKAAFSFGLSHFVLGFAGYFLGRLLQPAVSGIEEWAAVAFLVILGVKILLQTVKANPLSKVFDINSIRVILALSVAVGINALLVGLVLGFLNAPGLGFNIFTFFLVTFFTLFGLSGGHNLGMPFARSVPILGGVLFIVSGIMMAVEVLGYGLH